MKPTVRALGLICIISVASLASTPALARGGHFGGHGGGFRVGSFIAGALLAPLAIASVLSPPVYYPPSVVYPPAYYPPVYNAPTYGAYPQTYPQQTYPQQAYPQQAYRQQIVPPAGVSLAPGADTYSSQQSAAVGPPVPPAGSAPNFSGAGQSGPSWYYCAESRNYYPYVRECPSLWRPEPTQAQR